MVMTPSTMLELGTTAPDFELLEVVSGKPFSLSSLKGKKAILVMFICRHCPYVLHVKEEIARLGREYVPKEVGVVAISSNDSVKYPDDSPVHLKEMAQELGFNFPLCFDETQSVAKAYKAACTPEFYLFDKAFKLVYRGQLDGSRPGSQIPVTGHDLREALETVLSNKSVSQSQKPSVGCNIKWKPGNEPDYFH
jgi:peroxiredoxin